MEIRPEWLDALLGPFGLLVALLWALFGVIRGWWVPGSYYRIMKKDRDEWKDIAIKGLSVGERAVTLIERNVP